MDLSGIIFVVLAVAWAVYLIPKALKHHDEVARTRSIDRFSNAMRVLARREPASRRDTRLVVTPPRPAGQRVVVPPTPAPAPAPQPTASRRPAPGERAAARAAARRRRHILMFLLFADAAVATVAGLGFTPWWSVAIPAVLTVLYLVLCRTQVRRQSEAVWTSGSSSVSAEAPAEGEGPIAPRRAIRVDAPYGTPREYSAPDEEDTVALSAATLRAAAGAGSLAEAEEAVAVTVTTVDGESLWDPLPVTLPTYVGKAKAARTVRTIDLSAPGTWTSGRSEEDSRLVEQAEAESASASADAPAEQRAVGS